jgi:hypothetical protein
VQNWKDLPEDTRKLITSVRRVRAIFGTVHLKNALNENGEAVPTDDKVVPVIWEVENNTAFKIMGELLQKYRTAGHLFPQHEIALTTDGSPMANGNMLYLPVPEVDFTTSVEIVQPDDSDILVLFQSWVTFIIESHKKKSPDVAFTSDEQNVIDAFITVEES